MASRFKNLIDSLNVKPITSEVLTEGDDDWENYVFSSGLGVTSSPSDAVKNVEIWADSYDDDFKNKIEQFVKDFQEWLTITGQYINSMHNVKNGIWDKNPTFCQLIKDEKAMAYRLTKIYQRVSKS